MTNLGPTNNSTTTKKSGAPNHKKALTLTPPSSATADAFDAAGRARMTKPNISAAENIRNLPPAAGKAVAGKTTGATDGSTTTAVVCNGRQKDLQNQLDSDFSR